MFLERRKYNNFFLFDNFKKKKKLFFSYLGLLFILYLNIIKKKEINLKLFNIKASLLLFIKIINLRFIFFYFKSLISLLLFKNVIFLYLIVSLGNLIFLY